MASIFNININDKAFLRCSEGTGLSEILQQAGFVRPHPCGGKGICGKCTVYLNGKKVLACKTQIHCDSYISFEEKNEIAGVTYGISADSGNNPMLSSGYGAAIDIGTTTIAVYIYKFPECELVKSICIPNPQAAFGADVISRIEYYSAGGAHKLSECLRNALKKHTEDFSISKAVICGNTTMMHLLTGENPSSIAVAPYVAENLFGQWYGNAYLVRCSSAYVGGDITAALIACGIQSCGTALLVDIGTNGEMALKRGDKLFSCSAAAGPCFEGAGISCGTAAVEGAINSVCVSDDTIKYTTISDSEPVGICGSGLVDTIASLLRLGIIDSSGYMEDDYFFDNTSVYLSPGDVRKFQLAKSAVCSGILSLMEAAEIGFDDIDTFFIAGGFGTFLDVENAAYVGLIPGELVPKAKAVGNAAGAGASAMLINKELVSRSEAIAGDITNLSLCDSSSFADKYMNNMMFEV